MTDSTSPNSEKMWFSMACLLVFLLVASWCYFFLAKSTYMINAQVEGSESRPRVEKTLKPSASASDGLTKLRSYVSGSESEVEDRKRTQDVEVESTVGLIEGGDLNSLKGNTEALAAALETYEVDDTSLDDATELAINSSDLSVTTRAISAIARADSAYADSALMEIFSSVSNEQAHTQIIRQLNSNSLYSETSQWMFQELSSETVSPETKYQMAEKLVTAAIIEGQGDWSLAEELEYQVPYEVQEYIKRNLEIARTTGR
ncbi:Uncharacterised protein [BD1-7 clade bacterium]|uniref:Uncharacterized protein n=1 Tax=BD1-7 clade bacterium TaxID=2029982 RepID=A0A5S9QK82_9GAMM|nr:Uncharacterised protein [BD1-7 clade bacterium]CAA0118761.1 Uncharacterised protein [BD1-7 clade bacterium]